MEAVAIDLGTELPIHALVTKQGIVSPCSQSALIHRFSSVLDFAHGAAQNPWSE